MVDTQTICRACEATADEEDGRWSIVDEKEDGSGELICLEVNTQPGMTPTSLVPDMAAHEGMSFKDLVSWMVEDARCSA